MKNILSFLIPALFAFEGWAQEPYSHQSSSAPQTARYEIVQSERGARYTFKIDKYTGRVFQIAEKNNQDLTWEPILFLDPLAQNEITPNKVNFQVFISGLGARHIYLLQVDTGKTWQLAEDAKSGILVWVEFE
ncbi:MAG: hypothetical protein J0M29_12780 [Chitinophagales bacterium]|nr:hypothetical protein [Chitinophagales bacterium]